MRIEQVVKYRKRLLALLCLLHDKTRSKRGFSWTGKLISSLLLTLTHTYPLENKFVNPAAWKSEGLSIILQEELAETEILQSSRNVTTNIGAGSMSLKKSLYARSMYVRSPVDLTLTYTRLPGMFQTTRRLLLHWKSLRKSYSPLLVFWRDFSNRVRFVVLPVVIGHLLSTQTSLVTLSGETISVGE